MEKQNLKNKMKNSEMQSPKMPRTVVRLSDLLLEVGAQEAKVLNITNNQDEEPSAVPCMDTSANGELQFPIVEQNITWVCRYYEYSDKTEYDKQINNILEDEKIEVDEVMIITVAGDDGLNYDKLKVVGVNGGNYYAEWNDSGKYPYSSYCSSDKPGKLRLNVMYGVEHGDTLRLFTAKETKDADTNTSTLEVDMLTRSNAAAYTITAQTAFSSDKLIYEFLPNFSSYSNIDFIVDVDVLVDGYINFGKNNRFILDGGNFYRWYSMCDLPHDIVCKNGAIIYRNSEFMKDKLRLGANKNIFRNVSLFSQITPKGHQGLYSYEISVLDFIDPEIDYEATLSAATLNVTNILKRIFGALYEHGEPTANRFVIRFPENQYGRASYFLTEPLIIPYGVTVDFGGGMLVIDGELRNQDTDKHYRLFNPDNTKSVISFGHNPVYPILVTGQIRNVYIRLHNITRDMVEKVIDLTYFSGVLENVRIDLGYATDIVALWQPYGTPWITYSDMKIIRRCIIENFGWRVDTPTAIFCLGDGCIIEQSILGFVAIIGGNSYTIRGCLNDKYLVCDSSVDFTASYWEAGQFEILNSEVSFGCCRFQFKNGLRGDKDQNKYIGPFFSVDTKESYARLKTIFNDQHLNTDNYMEAIQGNNAKTVVSRVYERPSTVEFKPTMKVLTTFWGYTQPWSGPLFKVEGHPRIIGLENIASVGEVFMDLFTVPSEGNSDIGIGSTLAASIPLVNGDFYDWRTSIKVPDDVSIIAEQEVPWLCDGTPTDEMKKRAGLCWDSSQILTDIRAIFELDRKRKLYSPIYYYNRNVEFNDGEMPKIKVNVTYQNEADAPRNLKTILLFSYESDSGWRTYMARNHFKEVSYATLVNVGTRDIEFNPAKVVDVGEFSFIRRLGITDDLKVTEADGNQYHMAGLEYDTPRLQEYYRMPDVTCELGEDIDVPDCNGLCYGHACLCDNKGNLVPEVKECVYMYHDASFYNECSRMDLMGDVNVRAYVNEVPMTGEWVDGDEVVIEDQQAVYRYYGDTWHQII